MRPTEKTALSSTYMKTLHGVLKITLTCARENN